jgi:carbon monoxide dehydrogenase subunit G
MRIEKQFTVHSDVESVWRFLTDPRKVAGCLPGAAVTGQTDERTYTGTITVKVGPVATSYRGQIRFERLDAAAHTAEIAASGQDVRGKGGADLRMTSTLAARGPQETDITVTQDINVTGMLAQMGRGMIQDVGDQLFQRFTDAIRAQLEAGPPAAPSGASGAAPKPATPVAPAEPIQALSLGAGVAGRALGRTLRRPGFWIALLVVVIVLWWLLH